MPIDGITIAAIVFAVLAAIVFVFFMIRTKSSRKAGKGHAKNTKQNTKSNNKQIQSTVRSSIPYLHTFEEGIIETEPGVFTSAYRLADINFKIAPEEERHDTGAGMAADDRADTLESNLHIGIDLTDFFSQVLRVFFAVPMRDEHGIPAAAVRGRLIPFSHRFQGAFAAGHLFLGDQLAFKVHVHDRFDAQHIAYER